VIVIIDTIDVGLGGLLMKRAGKSQIDPLIPLTRFLPKTKKSCPKNHE
jgi:hypothetical protein